MDSRKKGPDLFQILSDYSYDGIQKQIKKMKRANEAINQDAEIVIEVVPEPDTAKFDGYTEVKFNVSLYIIHDQDN